MAANLNLKKVICAKMSILLFKRLSSFASAPTRATAGSIGYDLRSAVDCVIKAHGRAVINTDLAFILPRKTYGRIAAKSGLSVKHKIDIGAGVIDSDYRGNVGVVLINNGENDFEVWKGDQIAQLILEKAKIALVEEVEMLDETKRGQGGFGSTASGFQSGGEGLKRSNDGLDEYSEVGSKVPRSE